MERKMRICNLRQPINCLSCYTQIIAEMNDWLSQVSPCESSLISNTVLSLSADAVWIISLATEYLNMNLTSTERS